MHLRVAALGLGLAVLVSPAHAEYEQQLGPLARGVGAQLLQGWKASVKDGWFTLYNAQSAESEQTFYVTAGQPPENGRMTDVNVVVRSDKPTASIGVVLNNPAQKSLCLLEILADKNTLLFCVTNGKRQNIASVPNVAKLDGTDRIRVIEVPGAARFLVNGQKIGDIEDVPALGADIGIMAYDVGTFGVADFRIDSSLGGGKPSASPQPSGLPAPGGRTGAPQQQPQQQPRQQPASNPGGGLAGEGPYPNFGGDSMRSVAVYIGLMKSIFMHEFGHALIGELELPSTGAEEDAVDIYSALNVVEPTMYPGDDKDANFMAREAAIYAALQWYYSGKLAEAKGASATPWQDEHTADLKRFRNMFCIMYGANPGVFEGISKQVGFEDRTKGRCVDEFTKQNRAWRRLLAPHTRVGTWSPDGQLPANAPGAPVNVVFEPSSRKVGNLFATAMAPAIKTNLELLGKTYVLPRPINVTFKDCGKLNAWYSPRDGSITMCYELLETLAVMVSDVEMGTVGGEAKQGGAGRPQQQQQQPQQGGNRQGGTQQQGGGQRMAFDELVDSGVPPTRLLFSSPYKGPTPKQHAVAETITTEKLVYMFRDTKKIILIDTSGGDTTVPDAIPLPDAGSDGSIQDPLQSAMDSWLNKQTGGDRRIPIVFMGASMNDRSSYNGALRAATLGWPAYWYRGGLEAWTANGLPAAKVKPSQN